MPRFFCAPVANGMTAVIGEDARHLAKVLRAKPGEEYTLCDGEGMDYRAVITAISAERVDFSIVEAMPNQTEPQCKITLYQALPKGEKMDFIIQKAVELGVTRIVPVLSKYCVSRPTFADFSKKRERYQKIATAAAKQSGRGIIPVVTELVSFSDAVEEMAGACSFLCYEHGGDPIDSLVSQNSGQVRMLIGSEGGFSEEEAVLCRKKGIAWATLGSRILRCETAPLVALTLALHAAEEL